MLKINETPVRTSRSFGINNIKLEDVQIPNEIKQFEGLTITGDISKIEISDQVSNKDITYRLGDILKSQINQKSNQKIQLVVKDAIKEEINLIFDFDEDNTQLVENIEIITETNSKANHIGIVCVIVNFKRHTRLKNQISFVFSLA